MKRILIKALKTFIQAEIAYICTLSFVDVNRNDKAAVASILIATIAAGLSALMNIDWKNTVEK